MATTTSNHGLTKPAGTDNVDIGVINANMDKIDNMPVLYRQSSEPSNKVSGKTLWYDTTNELLKLWNGTAWEELGGGGGMEKLEDDTTPKLGGDLNANSKEIIKAYVKDYHEPFVMIEHTEEGTETLDFSTANIYYINVQEDMTIAFDGLSEVVGTAQSMTIILVGSSGHTITWPVALRWAFNTEPEMIGSYTVVNVLNLYLANISEIRADLMLGFASATNFPV